MSCSCRTRSRCGCTPIPDGVAGFLFCDTLANDMVIQFIRFFHTDGSITDLKLDGTGPYSPTGTVAPCSGDQAVTARGRTVTNGSPWPQAGPVPTGEPGGAVRSLTATGLQGTWTVTDGAGVTITALTAGTTLRWDADGENDLIPPQAITPDPGGSVVVTWTVR